MANNSSTSVGEPVPEIKSSRCVKITETTATLSFEVADYPQLEGMGVGMPVWSPMFRAGGYDWGILFYPNGYDYSCAGSASVSLHYLSQAYDVSSKYTLRLNVQGKEGQASVASFGPRKQVFCPGEFLSAGYAWFIDMSKLQDFSHLGNGSFTIQCVLTLDQNESPPLELPGHLERMLVQGTGADVTFGVGGHEFRAHKCVVAAQSPVFNAQFFGQMEKDMPRTEVVDVDPGIFKMLLQYMYTDSLPRCDADGGYNVSVMQHLLVAADRYGVDRLKLMCEEHLCKEIDMDTIKSIFALANHHSCKQLKAACLAFMASSPEVLGAIMETDGFKEHFMANCGPLPPLDWGSGEGKIRSSKPKISKGSVQNIDVSFSFP